MGITGSLNISHGAPPRCARPRNEQATRLPDYWRNCARAEAGERAAQERRDWGRWRLLPASLELAYVAPDGLPRDFIDLERCGTSAAVLDWIFQLNANNWTSVSDIGELVAALRDVFDPQATLCSYGAKGHPGKTLDATAYLKRRYPESGS